MQHAFNQNWTMSADYTHEQGNHGYRAYSYTSDVNLFTPLIPTSDPNYDLDQQSVVPNVNVFKSDNRSSYNALMLHLQGNVSRRFNLVAQLYAVQSTDVGMRAGRTIRLCEWSLPVPSGRRAFGPGDYGPSGEDVRHRFVLAGTLHLPGGVELTTMTQAKAHVRLRSRRQTTRPRISVNGVTQRLSMNFAGRLTFRSDLRGEPSVQDRRTLANLFRSRNSSTSSTGTIQVRTLCR